MPPSRCPSFPLRGLTPSPRPRRSRYGAARNAGHQRENLVISGDPSPAQILSLLPVLWIASHKQICNHVIQKPQETRKQHRVRAPTPPASCISGRVFLLSLYMCGCMCALRASMCVCVGGCGGGMCASRVHVLLCSGGVKELKRSIFTRCHSYSGRIINTQTHSHTSCMHAALRSCGHADTHIGDGEMQRERVAARSSFTFESLGAVWFRHRVLLRL